MAITSSFIQMNFGGTGSNPAQASTFQLVAPWGATQTCTTFEEAVNQLFRHSRYTGKMGQYFNSSTTNGLSSSITGSQTANDIISTDFD